MKVIKGTPKHLSRNGELNAFTYLMINLEFGCNYRCLKCFNRGENASEPTSTKPITLQDRIGLVKQAKDLGGKVVVIAGEGEPSIHKDTKALVTEVNSSGLIPIVYTNGRIINKELTDFYRQNNAVLVISLDSLRPKIYDRLTGTTDQLKNVLKNVRTIRDIYLPTKVTKNDVTILSLALNTTVSGVNHTEVSEIREFCGEDIYFICNPLARLGNADINWSKLMRQGEDTEDYNELIQKMSESGGPLTLGLDGLCGYSKWGIAISPTGDYMTCAYTSKTNGLLSNVRKTQLKEAFEYKQYMEAEHYKRHGISPCLVRATSFQEYLGSLISQQAFCSCYGERVGRK